MNWKLDSAVSPSLSLVYIMKRVHLGEGKNLAKEKSWKPEPETRIWKRSCNKSLVINTDITTPWNLHSRLFLGACQKPALSISHIPEAHKVITVNIIYFYWGLSQISHQLMKDFLNFLHTPPVFSASIGISFNESEKVQVWLNIGTRRRLLQIITSSKVLSLLLLPCLCSSTLQDKQPWRRAHRYATVLAKIPRRAG